MIDIHCHILPRIDDGARSLQESLAMIRTYVRDGVTHLVATPHCNSHLQLYRADIIPQVQRLNDVIRMQGINLMVLPGSEIQLINVAQYRKTYEKGLFCHLGDGRTFTLLEFPWRYEKYPDGAAEQVFWLRERGMTPIIAHPERQPFFRDNPELVHELVDAGAWLQLTVDSVTGVNGPPAQIAAETIISTYLDVVLASDAHRMERCSGLTVGYETVEARFGTARAEDLDARANYILQNIL
jgi:protein-tyrosine phosphatase